MRTSGFLIVATVLGEECGPLTRVFSQALSCEGGISRFSFKDSSHPPLGCPRLFPK